MSEFRFFSFSKTICIFHFLPSFSLLIKVQKNGLFINNTRIYVMINEVKLINKMQNLKTSLLHFFVSALPLTVLASSL
jgi:hypothetical protein